MTVYVDDMRAQFRGMTMCHMIADTDQELHAMADKIGVLRKWYQNDHYDIALAKRQHAVRAGAREITWRQAGLMMVNRRAGFPMGTPETAEEILHVRRAKTFKPIGFIARCGIFLGLVEIIGVAVGDEFVVHNVVGCFGPISRWAVSHRHSGLRVYDFEKLDHALKFALEISAMAEWNEVVVDRIEDGPRFPSDKFRDALRHEVRRRYDAFCLSIGCC